MIKTVRQTIRLFSVAMFSWLLLISPPSYSQAVGAEQIAKLAKQFSVSPDVLKKFSGMSLPDINKGLGMAKQLAGKGELSMDQATDEVMNAAMNGKGWDSIATDFGLDTLTGISGGDKAAGAIKSGVVGGSGPVNVGKPKKKILK